MPRSVKQLARLVQPSLFQTPPAHPSFRGLPPETQGKTIVLLARLLRDEADRTLRVGQDPAGRDE